MAKPKKKQEPSCAIHGWTFGFIYSIKESNVCAKIVLTYTVIYMWKINQTIVFEQARFNK